MNLMDLYLFLDLTEVVLKTITIVKIYFENRLLSVIKVGHRDLLESFMRLHLRVPILYHVDDLSIFEKTNISHYIKTCGSCILK